MAGGTFGSLRNHAHARRRRGGCGGRRGRRNRQREPRVVAVGPVVGVELAVALEVEVALVIERRFLLTPVLASIFAAAAHFG
jgi:hypothetical protein